MNKYDISLMILIICIISVFLFSFSNSKQAKKAMVYFQNELILEVDLTKSETREYMVSGLNGPVQLVASEGKIKVKEEDSPKHLCSKQGYISSSQETIVCLPNAIVIRLEADRDLDTVAK